MSMSDCTHSDVYAGEASRYLAQTRPLEHPCTRVAIDPGQPPRCGEGTIPTPHPDSVSANRLLDQFASVVSHDLRAPLMTIEVSAHMLIERLSSEVQGETAELMGYLSDGVHRLRELVNGLVSYSRTGLSGVRPISCNCELLLARVIAGLRADIEQQHTRVTFGEMPTVYADETLLSRVLQNLIENAIKYHAGDPPEVHISARDNGAEWLFSVRDNGIGIDPRHFDEIFCIFRRLNPELSACSGLGIGLAICRKIIECHGGRIYVESSPGQGATFLFTLPK